MFASASAIPDNAIEVVQETWDTGNKKRAYYFVGEEEVGFRFWNPSGILAMESGIRDGVRHGRYRTWHENGQLEEDATYEYGKEHGETKQYDENGVKIGHYVMEHGTGVDLWFCAPGLLSEEREYRDGQRHGYERWWNGDSQTINEETHFQNDIEHGIFRAWNRHGRLRRGYPRYYVAGKRATKRQYERACRKDSTLPRFVSSDNHPSRQLPAVLASDDYSYQETALQLSPPTCSIR